MLCCVADSQARRVYTDWVLVCEELGHDNLQPPVRALHAVHYAAVPGDHHVLCLRQHLLRAVGHDQQKIRHAQWNVGFKYMFARGALFS